MASPSDCGQLGEQYASGGGAGGGDGPKGAAGGPESSRLISVVLEKPQRWQV